MEAFWRRASPTPARPDPLRARRTVQLGPLGPIPQAHRGLAPDLPGFGRSDKPASFDYSIPGYDRWIEAFIDQAGLERFSLVVHDWGAVGPRDRAAVHERLHRLVVIAAVPFLPGYEWHSLAKIWRTPFVGEMARG